MSLSEDKRSVVIDCHCHTFNAKDLPIFGFLEKVALNADEKVLPKLVLPLARMLTKLTKRAPGTDKELAKLSILLDQSTEAGAFGIAAIDGEDQEDTQFLKDLNTAIYDLGQSDQEEDAALLSVIEAEADKPETVGSGAKSVFDVAEAIWKSRGIVSRYIKWIHLLTKYRYKITRRLVETYSEDGDTVDLFTPALIDYDRWVADKAQTDLPSQIRLMKGNIRLHKGRVHPYFPFDPWREAMSIQSEDGSLYWLQEAVEHNGFIGAKLYPPMGYRATDNASLTEFPEEVTDPPAVFGQKLDEAMEALFEYCKKKGVPILTHCANSNETRERYGDRANPIFWELVAKKYPSLRINLGHFGGLGSLSSIDGWAWKVGELLNDSNTNVYADISHFSAILDDSDRQVAIDNLKRLFDQYPNAKDRILFGTDWIMLARVRKHKEFLDIFRDAYQEAFGENECAKFMGLNAAKFLGLMPGQRNRQRLEAFYDKHEIKTPLWAQRID